MLGDINEKIIKSLFITLIVTTIIIISNTGATTISITKASHSNISGFLNKLSGTWYDNTGKAVLYIDQNGINGFAVKSITDLAGGGGHGIGTFRILENGNYKDLRIEWNTTGQTKYLILNHGVTLQNTPNVQHFESIGGIYLGMTDKEVLKAYGTPNSIEDGKLSKRITWSYTNDGWKISFYKGRVDQITILKNGSRRLDISGYNCDNSLGEFAEFYNVKNIRVGAPIHIAKGEYLWIYKDVANMDRRAARDGINVDHIVLTIHGN